MQYLTDRVFGRWLVVCYSHKTEFGSYWYCKCTCGEERLVYGGSLNSGASKSCGCIHAEFEDLTGQKYGSWIVKRFSHKTKYRDKYWICECSCGNSGEREVKQNHLKSGKSKSCGCLNKGNTQHGMCYTPEYNSWQGTKDRCYNPNNPSYEYYGARGIIVCERWLNSFENFYADMGSRPEPKFDYSLERVDNDGNYEPNNCKWATLAEQNNNQRAYGKVAFYGVTKSSNGKRFKSEIRINSRKKYLGTFDTALQAATAYDDAYEEFKGIRKNNTIKDV